MMRLDFVLSRLLLVAILLAAVGALPAAAQPAPVNVLQDCWTTDLDQDSDLEKELYTFAADAPVTFVWKHKILASCTSYVFTIRGTTCIDGKPGPAEYRPIRFRFRNVPLGPISPDPLVPEPLIAFTAAPGSIPPGTYDWVLAVECDDTNGTVAPDGDIEDVCGINKGTTLGGPLIMGPEPVQVLDPDPGGSPPGRAPGESGTTRPWCFTVEEPPPPFDLCAPQDCGTFGGDCDGGPDACFCFELYDAPGTGGCLQDAPCGANCSANGSADCAAGEVCVFNTCCGYPNCLPAMCGAPGPVFAPGSGQSNAGFPQ